MSIHIQIFDLEKGLSSLEKELKQVADRTCNIESLDRVLSVGAVPIVDEIKNQVAKAKYTHRIYTSGKRRPGLLARNVRTELVCEDYLNPKKKIGFTKKGAHSNILENSNVKILRHIKPATDLRKEESVSKMQEELQKIINQK